MHKHCLVGLVLVSLTARALPVAATLGPSASSSPLYVADPNAMPTSNSARLLAYLNANADADASTPIAASSTSDADVETAIEAMIGGVDALDVPLAPNSDANAQELFDLPPLIRPVPASVASAIDARFSDLPDRTDEPIPILLVEGAAVDDTGRASPDKEDVTTGVAGARAQSGGGGEAKKTRKRRRRAHP